METNNKTTNNAGKTTSFNLIILDESGSMSDVVKETISGCNETLGVIRQIQKDHPDTQRCLASIYVFQSGHIPSRYLYKNKPIDKVNTVTVRDYRPAGCTPLLDAVGMTLTDLKAVAETHEDATASITIITDGYENSSREYTWKMVADMIAELKEKGWNFNFIGANIDVEAVSKRMNIDNALAFEADAKGARDMWNKYSSNLHDFEEERIVMEADMVDMPDRLESRKMRSKNFFRK